MRKKSLAIVLAALVLLIALVAAGCGTQATAGGASGGDTGGKSKLTKEIYAQIETGMTVDNLKSVAGEPSRTEAKSMGGGHNMGDGDSMGDAMEIEYWYYQGDKGWVRLEVAEDKVYSKSGY
jgi:hypothetical protein